MGKVEDISYIKKIGIKKTLFATNMGNVIHILNNGQKYKEFGADYHDLSDTVNVIFREDLIFQTEEYGNELISFPQLVISSDKELFGIVGDYEVGQPLLEIDPLLELEKAISLVEKMENGILSLSQRGWNLEDIHEENILINVTSSSKPIRIIDTDYYCFQPDRDKKELYRQNIKKIFRAVIDSILPELNISGIWIDKEFNKKYLLASNGLLKTSEFLKFLINKVNFTLQESKNVQTLRKSI